MSKIAMSLMKTKVFVYQGLVRVIKLCKWEAGKPGNCKLTRKLFVQTKPFWQKQF